MKSIDLLLISIIVYIINFFYNKLLNSVYVVSTIDNQTYLVKNTHDKQAAADTLAKINMQLQQFIKCLVNKQSQFTKKNQIGIRRLQQKYNPKALRENIGYYQDLFSKNSTSYSVNKGNKIILCLRSKKDNKIQDHNILMFVALHEMSHLMSESYQHTQEFWNNYKFLLEQAIKCKIYTYEKNNFKNNPVEYCGMTITNSPLDT